MAKHQIAGTKSLITASTNIALMANDLFFFGQATVPAPGAPAPSSASTLTDGIARILTLASQAKRTIGQNVTLLYGQDWVFKAKPQVDD